MGRYEGTPQGRNQACNTCAPRPFSAPPQTQCRPATGRVLKMALRGGQRTCPYLADPSQLILQVLDGAVLRFQNILRREAGKA